MTTKKSGSVAGREFLEKLEGRPLSLGDVLSSLRFCDDMKLAEFSKLLGISAAHLCDIEKMRRFVSLGRAARFAHKLGYPEKLFVTLALNDLLRKEGLPGKATYVKDSKKKKAA